jgi:thioredoxin-related protein
MLKRHLLALAAGFCLAAATGMVQAAEVGDDGLHKQPFFHDSFLEFGDDLAEAAAEGKDLLILIEQAGCPYCRELHEVNFARSEITDYIKEHYVVIQLDLFGARGTVDFDGQELEERDLVEKWNAQFTPTTIIFSHENVGATTAAEAEAFRLPGYLRPFHYMTSLEYVTTGAYKEQSLQRFLRDKIQHLEEQGISPDVW